MKLNVFQKASGLLLACLLGTAVQAQTVSASIPDSVSGTYTLTYTFGTTPFAANTVKTVVINGANETLCVDGVSLGAAYLRDSSGQEPLWLDTTNSIVYGLSITNGVFNEINVYSPNDQAANWKGQFTGIRTSTSTANCAGTGGGTAPTLSLTTDAQAVFDLAFDVYPTLFSSGSELRETQGYIYRFFAASGIYVGVKDGNIYVVGGPFGTSIKPMGTFAAVNGKLQTAKINLQNANNGSTSGLYDLTISGTFRTSGIVSTTINISNIMIADIPAPAATDTQAFVDAVSSMGATSITGLTVQVINNTATRVTFRVQFTAALTGFGSVNYDLTYDYNK